MSLETKVTELYQTEINVSTHVETEKALCVLLRTQEYFAGNYEASEETGEVLLFEKKPIDLPVFTVSNNGFVKSAKEVWPEKGNRVYLPAHFDMYDKISGKSEINGHGVGLSICGSNYMAEQGFMYEDILKYYFPETTLLVLSAYYRTTIEESEKDNVVLLLDSFSAKCPELFVKLYESGYMGESRLTYELFDAAKNFLESKGKSVSANGLTAEQISFILE